jgi:tetratricopeptide (TPR) repeat protein
LNKEAVQARPPSAAYRFQKFVHRNTAAFALASVVVVGVVLAAIGLAVSNYLIREEQAKTHSEWDRAEHSRRLAEQRADEVRDGLERLKAANGWLEEGRAELPGRHWNDAKAAFTKALDLRPDHATAWNERGNLHANLGLWELASVDFARELEIREPEGTIRWFRLALLRLASGDTEGYAHLRDRMNSRFRGTLNRFSASEVVRASILKDDSEFDFRSLLDLAKRLARTKGLTPFDQYLLGIALYRAGDDAEAIASLRASLAVEEPAGNREMAYPVMAMCHHRRGELAEARAALENAKNALERWTHLRCEAIGNTHWAVDQGATAIWPIAWWDWVEFNVYFREATLLIEGALPVEDPRLHVLRARSFAGLRDHAAAGREFATAIQLGLADPRVRMEMHRCAGYSAVARKDWNAAASAFVSAGELAPDDAVLACFQAVALAAAGRYDEYRRMCSALVERFGDTKDAVEACNVLFACALVGDAVPDASRLLNLANVGDAAWHFGFWVRGATYYRMAKYEECIRTFEAAADLHRLRAWDWAFLAMAHQRLGHEDEARRCLREAARWIEEASRETGLESQDGLPKWGGWHEKVVYPMLLNEAQALIGEG